MERFMDEVKEVMKLLVVREEDAEERAGWRQMIGCGLPAERIRPLLDQVWSGSFRRHLWQHLDEQVYPSMPHLSATLASTTALGGNFHGQFIRPPGNLLKSNWQQILGSGPQV